MMSFAKNTAAIVIALSAISYAPAVFAQAAGGGDSLPSDAKKSPTATSGVKEEQMKKDGSMSKSDSMMKKDDGSMSKSDMKK